MFNCMLLSSTYFQLKYLRLSYYRLFINSNIFELSTTCRDLYSGAAVESGPVEKTLVPESIFNKVLGYYPLNLFKKRHPSTGVVL